MFCKDEIILSEVFFPSSSSSSLKRKVKLNIFLKISSDKISSSRILSLIISNILSRKQSKFLKEINFVVCLYKAGFKRKSKKKFLWFLKKGYPLYKKHKYNLSKIFDILSNIL